jgi:carbonic anhydrase
MIVGCVDPRVDPTLVLGVQQGESAVIRNVGGRVTPATLRTMTMLAKVGEANGGGHHAGDWNLVLLHHTDCGMTDLARHTELLAEYFEIPSDRLGEKAVSDPYVSVQVDVDVILRHLRGARFLVSGLVYDVSTGLVEVVVPPTPLPVDGEQNRGGTD